MRHAAALGIFALGLTGWVAIACAPSYGETDPPPAGATGADTYKTNLPTDPSTPKVAPPAKTTSAVTSNSDAGSAPPKTPGSGGGSDTTDASTSTTQLDGGSCAKAPAPGGYVIHEPTPQSIGACSSADIGYYEGLLAVKDQTFGGIQKAMNERSALCANCIFSKYEDPTWTPVVMLSADGGFYNWGSCYANSPGGSPACAMQVQQWFSCLDDACADCVSDADYTACVDKASADPKQCGSLKFDACGTNLESLNKACDTIAKSITVSCGP
jgi:hypothetical protein